MSEPVLVGSVNFDDEIARFEFDDLQPVVTIEETFGVSCALERPSVSSPYGFVRLRIIHDCTGRAFLYRRDDAGTTYFSVRWLGGIA